MPQLGVATRAAAYTGTVLHPKVCNQGMLNDVLESCFNSRYSKRMLKKKKKGPDERCLERPLWSRRDNHGTEAAGL